MSMLSRITDHPLRHIVQNALLTLPGTGRVQQSKTTTGAMNNPDLMAEWAEQVFTAARSAGVEIRGARVAEVGPGHSLGVAACLVAAGAAVASAVDVRQFADPANVEAWSP